MLHPPHCLARQQRLRAALPAACDVAVCSLPHHVYYLTGHLNFWQHHSAVILFRDGPAVLITANEPNRNAAADEFAWYEAQWNCTLRQEQPDALAEQVRLRLTEHGARTIAADTSPVTAALMRSGPIDSLDPILWQLRRAKDPDELTLMRKAIECCDAMYRRAREIIAPGILETEVFAELHKTAVMTAQEPLSALLGNDYACGVPGGPARPGRAAQPGEIYILDLGPAYRGYFSDNCRAFAVDRKPTDEQLRAHAAILGALRIVESIARPGARCRDIFNAVDQHFRDTLGTSMPHHLGHGVGLQPHEFPHLNLSWDDTLIEGEIFTAEPGQYGPALAGGIRVENQYLVTPTGVECLTPFPTDL